MESNIVKLSDIVLTTPNGARLIRAGDAARDAGAWRKAAALYEQAVDRNPKLKHIWVQLGNCRKEAGQLRDAEAAYCQSLELDPSIADTHLQLGHVLKLQGRLCEAKASYAAALRLEPSSADAQAEVAALRNVPQLVSPDAHGSRILFDCSDLIQYFSDNRLPTGIQRVQINIVKSALNSEHYGARTHIVFFKQDHRAWYYLGHLDFLFLVNSAQDIKNVDVQSWESIRNRLCSSQSASSFSFNSHDLLINLGTSWWIQDYFLQIRNLKKNHKITYVPFVHDCIPLIVPEHCEHNLVKEFYSWITGVFQHSDGFLTNSQSTTSDLCEIAQRLNYADPDPQIIKLDGDMRDGSAAIVPASMSGALAELFSTQGIPTDSDEPPQFVLFVSTLESRKNHMLIFGVWSSLINKIGLSRTPYLLCVGKKGWLFDPALNFLNGRRELASRVKLMSNIGDELLAELYSLSTFTVYPSHYEGWGLPVTESLCFGKVPVVSRVSSLPETGGEFAQYFDPRAPGEAYALVERLLLDKQYRVSLEEKIKVSFRPRSWSEITTRLVELAEAVRTEAARSDGAERWVEDLEVGVLYGMVPRATAESLLLRSAEHMRFGDGWHPCEHWGAWTGAQIARMQFRLPEGDVGGLTIMLQLRGAPGVESETRIHASFSDEVYVVPFDPDETKWAKLHFAGRGKAKRTGELLLSTSPKVNLAGSSDGTGERTVGCGVLRIGLCSQADLTSRVALMESMIFSDGRSYRLS